MDDRLPAESRRSAEERYADVSAPLARIARMAAAFAGSTLVRGAIGFATSLVIARGLGREDFGRWVFCMAWASVLTSAFDLGFGVLLTRDAATSQHRLGDLVGNALSVRLILFLPAALLVRTTALRVVWSGGSTDTLTAVVWLAAVSLAYGCLSAVFRAWPKWLVTILGVEAVGAALQCVGSLWAVARGVSALLWLAVAIQLAQLVVALALFRVVRSSDEPIAWTGMRSALALLRRALPFAMTGIVANAQTRLAPLMLGYLSSPAEVASFGAASRIGSVGKMLPSAAFAGALPVFAHEVGRGPVHAVRARFNSTLGIFVGVVATVTIVGAGPLVQVTYGTRFAPAAPAVVWIGIGLVPFVANSSRKIYLYAAGRERIALAWSTVALAVQAIGCAALASTFGARGAAAALAIGEAVVWWPLRRAESVTDLGPWSFGLGSSSLLSPWSPVRPERTKN